MLHFWIAGTTVPLPSPVSGGVWISGWLNIVWLVVGIVGTLLGTIAYGVALTKQKLVEVYKASAEELRSKIGDHEANANLYHEQLRGCQARASAEKEAWVSKVSERDSRIAGLEAKTDLTQVMALISQERIAADERAKQMTYEIVEQIKSFHTKQLTLLSEMLEWVKSPGGGTLDDRTHNK